MTAEPGKAVVTISLDDTTVPAGTPIRGTATVDNRTGAAIALPGGTCDGWLFVGLSNARLPYEPANGLVGCRAYNVPVGQSRYPITVSTRYQTCIQTPAQVSYSLPACLTDGSQSIPALPAGTYQTTVRISGPITPANSVEVTLTAPNRKPGVSTPTTGVVSSSCPAAGRGTIVPDVVGLASEQAYAVLAHVGLLASTGPSQDSAPTSDRLPGSVVAESPGPGSKVVVGARISLEVAVNSTAGSGGGYPAPPYSLPPDWCATP